MTAQELLKQLRELKSKNNEAYEFSIYCPDETSVEEKLANAKVQHETHQQFKVTFDDFMAALAEMPEAKRQSLAREAMTIGNAKPVSPVLKKRLQK